AAAAGLALAGLGAFLDVRTTGGILEFVRTATALALGVAPALVVSTAAEALARRQPLLYRLRAPFEGLFATGALLAWPTAAVRAGRPVGMALPFLALGALPLRRATAAASALVAVPAFALALAAGAALQRLPFLRGAARTAASVLARADRPVTEQLAAAPAATACAAFLVAVARALARRSGVRGWIAPFRHAGRHEPEAQEHAAAGAP